MACGHRTMLAYWKFESISLQQRVNKLSVPQLQRSIVHLLQSRP